MVGFNNIIGHEEIIRHLKNAIKTGKVSHSYIFTGRPGSGLRPAGRNLLFSAARATDQNFFKKISKKWRLPGSWRPFICIFGGKGENHRNPP